MTVGAQEFSFGTCASPGRRRRQEDYCAVWYSKEPSTTGEASPVLVVLADGMGGHVSGHLASELACESYIEYFASGAGDVGPRMVDALERSNAAIAEEIQINPDYDGMGCTLVAAYFEQEGLRWVSVGDSALLLYRGGALRRLNADHSHGAVLDRQAAEGIITHEAAISDARRRALHSALTGQEIRMRDLELSAHRLYPGDWIIAASDGLLTLDGNEIARALHDNEDADPTAMAELLIAAVTDRDKPGQDNTTIVAIKILGDGPRPDRVPAEKAPQVVTMNPARDLDRTETGPLGSRSKG